MHEQGLDEGVGGDSHHYLIIGELLMWCRGVMSSGLDLYNMGYLISSTYPSRLLDMHVSDIYPGRTAWANQEDPPSN